MKIKEQFKKNKRLILFFLLEFSLILFVATFVCADPDYFWHIKAGEYMVKNNCILRQDVFSWIMNGKYWFSHEWLFEVIIYILKLLFGKWHIFLYVFFSLSLLFLILFFTRKKEYIKKDLFSVFWLLNFLIFIFFIQVRPHLLSYSFLAITIYLCYDLFTNKNSKKIYFLPALSILWANFHGGSSNLSYVFCLIFIFAGLFKFNFKKIESDRLSWNQIRRYLIVSLLCIIFICFNPHGIKMLGYPYQNMLDNVMIDFISEWQPTKLSSLSHYPYILLLVFILFCLIFSKEKIKFIDFVLFGVSCFLGLKSVRFWPYTVIIMNYCIFNYISDLKIHKNSSLIFMYTTILLFMFSFIRFNSFVKYDYDSSKFSNIVEILKLEKPNKLFNMYDYGGILIYNDIDVFIDGRADLYSKHNMIDYKNISLLRDDYVKLIDKYNFDCFLVNKNYPIYTYLKYNSSYKLIYNDKNMCIFKLA